MRHRWIFTRVHLAHRLVDVGDGGVEFGAQHDLARRFLCGFHQVQADDWAAVALLHVVESCRSL